MVLVVMLVLMLVLVVVVFVKHHVVVKGVEVGGEEEGRE